MGCGLSALLQADLLRSSPRWRGQKTGGVLTGHSEPFMGTQEGLLSSQRVFVFAPGTRELVLCYSLDIAARRVGTV